MGITIDAHCFGCGYDVVKMIGSGFLNFQTTSTWPVKCPRCKAVATANAREKLMTCDDCGCEDVTIFEEIAGGDLEDREWERLRKAVHGRPPEGVGSHPPAGRLRVESEGPYSLWRGRYACPKCGAAQLRFGTWVNGSAPMDWD